jgi:hypothetical protein
MSRDVRYWEWVSPEECLEWLFENYDMKAYKSLNVWQESFATLGGRMLAGGFSRLTPAMLEGRNYTVRWWNDSVAIRYHDEVFINKIENRRYPENTRCILARLPFTN